jgi:hypothetical protein
MQKIDEPIQDHLRAGEQATQLRDTVLSFMPAVAS